MQGKVLDYNLMTAEGLISGEDGERYSFKGSDIRSQVQHISAGAVVDFKKNDDRAEEIFFVKTSTDLFAGQVGEKSKMVAALLAFFLGWLGIHKFYLGYNTAGIIMLLCAVPGALLFGIPTAVIALIAFIEFIIYLTKSDEDFYQTYEVNKREWF
ncbi:TM2 domain-containing protein [Neokomagataea thailandica]|uniref:TM2 domain-containing protein n=1 Tax=Neokomagataea tanensis NBRC 106556 TaxID=1223519 RepID=A0ABQ0QHD7_9PROT|nr:MULTISPECIES: TM2 domain-containing protein [Neokomagataea]GBR44907.1 hypothetical protein AA106556_0585 [Neokomagataea tanensis NBRC 106556]